MRRFSITIVSALVMTAVLGQASLATAADLFSVCVPVEVGVFADRIHVKCATPLTDATTGQSIVFLAVPAATNTTFGDRFLATATTAYVSARPLLVLWSQGSATNPPGCGADNCRLAKAIVIQ